MRQQLLQRRGNSAPRWWQQALRRFDDMVIAASTRICGPGSSLVIMMSHGIYRDEDEAFSGSVDPYQPLTTANLAIVIECFLAGGYRFITPADLDRPFEANARCVLLTFDDGYANNLRALPILQRYGVPATFFIAAGHVASGEAFWWDVLYRERLKRNNSLSEIVAERQKLKSLDNKGIKAHLRTTFGDGVFQPVSEIDRPLTVAELQRLAADPLVTLGNHTVDHELLTRIPLDEARAQIRDCQTLLEEWTGVTPPIIAYPNGVYNEAVVAEAEKAGLRAGLISVWGRTRLPLDSTNRMRLPRYATSGGRNTERDCRVIMAPFSLSAVKQSIRSRRQQRALP
ncbi:MAG: polysaccharide deacetylase family protein [Alphaproteobacteria bacterium]|nr:polysaccharide deacetylase family protein [Alphaproteobacteria bacterium]MCB9929775.1 polysaccharide deacetylase family protein [Alphaproteobacteria bacterium]